MEKEKLYQKISQEILENIGGSQNIQGAAHCATRLRIVLKDLSLVKTDKWNTRINRFFEKFIFFFLNLSHRVTFKENLQHG